MDIWKIPISQFHLIWIMSLLWHPSHPQMFRAIGWCACYVCCSRVCLYPYLEVGENLAGPAGTVRNVENPWAWYGTRQSWDLSICPAGILFQELLHSLRCHMSLCNMGHSNLSLWRPLKRDSEMCCCVFKKAGTKPSRMDLQKQITPHNKDISYRYIPWLMLFGHVVIKRKCQHSLLQLHS